MRTVAELPSANEDDRVAVASDDATTVAEQSLSSPTLDGVRQFRVSVDRDEWKLDTLCDLFETFVLSQVIVYCNTQDAVRLLEEQLGVRDLTTSVLCVEQGANEYERNFREFRSGSSKLLLCTEFPGPLEGLPGVAAIINYDFPSTRTSYLCRVGRTDRCRPKGVVINFVTEMDKHVVEDIESSCATTIAELPQDVADSI